MRSCYLVLQPDFFSFLLSIYLPCDNYSNNHVNEEYIDCIHYIEHLYNNTNSNAFICCGDFNSCFERHNAHTTGYLNNFHC